jgi:hypothetical protein
MDNKKMKRFGVLVICLALSLDAMARGGGGGGGHGGSGHASGHASGEGGHGEGEGESTSHEEDESSEWVVIIPHGSSAAGVCKNGVDTAEDISASETQVRCKDDPSHIAGKLVFGCILLLILALVIAILAA